MAIQTGWYAFIFNEENDVGKKNAAVGAVYIGELTQSQHDDFVTRYKKKYTGIYFYSFVHSQRIPAQVEGYLNLLLNDAVNLSGGRQRVLKTAIVVANEVRLAHGCGDKNVSDVFQEYLDKANAAFMALSPFSDPLCLLQATNKTVDIPPVVNAPDVVKAVDKLTEHLVTKEEMTEAVRNGMKEGLLDTYALSKKAEQKEIRARQEDWLLDSGRKPTQVARIHNPYADEVEIRKESQRISNERNDRKKKES